LKSDTRTIGPPYLLWTSGTREGDVERAGMTKESADS
jgi:hypothetical protein